MSERGPEDPVRRLPVRHQPRRQAADRDPVSFPSVYGVATARSLLPHGDSRGPRSPMAPTAHSASRARPHVVRTEIPTVTGVARGTQRYEASRCPESGLRIGCGARTIADLALASIVHRVAEVGGAVVLGTAGE